MMNVDLTTCLGNRFWMWATEKYPYTRILPCLSELTLTNNLRFLIWIVIQVVFVISDCFFFQVTYMNVPLEVYYIWYKFKCLNLIHEIGMKLFAKIHQFVTKPKNRENPNIPKWTIENSNSKFIISFQKELCMMEYVKI